MRAVQPKYLIALAVVIAVALFVKISNPHKKYSTQQFWESATVQTVSEVPQDALKKDNPNGSVLMWAAMGANDPKIIAALVNRGADVNESDVLFSGTPLTGAAGYSKVPAVLEELVRLGADVNVTVNNLKTPLMIAAQYNKAPQIIETLVALGADSSRRNAQNRTAFDLAKLKNNETALAALTSLEAK